MKVLYVDDEAPLLSSFQSLMRKEAVRVSLLNDSAQIESVLDIGGPFAVVLSDQRMPARDGVAVLECVRHRSPGTVRILMTGFSDHADTTRAVNIGGISHYVSKPWNDDDLKMLIRESVAKFNLIEHNAFLANVISAKNEELRLLLDGTVTKTVKILGEVIGSVTPKGTAQTDRLKKFASMILTLVPADSEQEEWNILRACELYHLGLTMLPAWVQLTIAKDGLNAVDRFPAARAHHLLAARMLSDIPRLDGIASILRLAHKNFDGTGEPVYDPAAGTDIPLGARILHILIDMEKRSTQNFSEKEVLQSMLNFPRTYDVEIIRLMLGKSQPKQPTHIDLLLSVPELRVGMLLLQDVVTGGGHVLMKAYSALSESALNMLLEWHASDPIREPLHVRKLFH